MERISNQRILTALWEHRGDLQSAYKSLRVPLAEAKRVSANEDFRLYADYISSAFDATVQDKMIRAYAETKNEMHVCHSVGLPPDVVLRIREYDVAFAQRWEDVESGRHAIREQMKIVLAQSNLTSRQLDCLDALRSINAISKDTRRSADRIASTIERSADANTVKVPLAELKRLGLVDSSRGRGSGSWITEVGLRALEKHRPKR